MKLRYLFFAFLIIQLISTKAEANNPIKYDNSVELNDTLSWGPYDYLKKTIEKVQSAVVVMGPSTGVMVSDSFGITAAHVPTIEGDTLPDYIWARNIFGQTIRVSKVWFHVERDFAVFKLANPFDSLNSIPIAEKDVSEGDTIFQVGNPENVSMGGLGWAVSFGKFKKHHYDGDGISVETSFKVYTNNGFSGSPIVNTKGEIVSVASAGGWEDHDSPYFDENSKIHNTIWDVLRLNESYGPSLSFMKGFIEDNNIILGEAGGNYILPKNIPDRPKRKFVSDSDFEIIKEKSIDTRQGVVGISTSYPRNEFDTEFSKEVASFRGTGTLVDRNFVLTANHVVSQVEKNNVAFTDGYNDNDAINIFSSPYFDIAMLKLGNSVPERFPSIKLSSKKIDWMEPGYTIGHTGYRWRLNGGWQISSLIGYGTDKGDLMTMGVSGSGNSGGGFFDIEGRIAGVLWGSSSRWGGGGAVVQTPKDYQDPHATDYWPTADQNSTSAGTDYSIIKEFVSKYTIHDGDGYEYTYKGAKLSDGKIVTTGRDFNGTDNDIILNIYSKNGVLLNTFSDSRSDWEAGNDIVVLENDKIIIVGNSHDKDKSKLLITCFKSDGTLDTSFGEDGRVITSINNIWDEGVSVKIQDDGKIWCSNG